MGQYRGSNPFFYILSYLSFFIKASLCASARLRSVISFSREALMDSSCRLDSSISLNMLRISRRCLFISFTFLFSSCFDLSRSTFLSLNDFTAKAASSKEIRASSCTVISSTRRSSCGKSSKEKSDRSSLVFASGVANSKNPLWQGSHRPIKGIVDFPCKRVSLRISPVFLAINSKETSDRYRGFERIGSVDLRPGGRRFADPSTRQHRTVEPVAQPRQRCLA